MKCEGFGRTIFENHYIIDTQQQVAVHMCAFDGVQRGNYCRGELRKVKNGKAASKDEITEERIKGRGEMVVDWNWSLCNKAFESGIMLEG